jgi:Uncharacterized conserved protein
MKTFSVRWSPHDGWTPAISAWPASADLVLYFGARQVLALDDGPRTELLAHFSTALSAGCSTAGEILDHNVSDGGLAALCVTFDHTTVRAETIAVHSPAESFAAAAELSQRLASPELRHVLVLSDGLLVNGTHLTAGFRAGLPHGVHVTGGLAGDGSAFRHTLVGLGPNLGSGSIVAIGFYGSRLRVAHGSAGGWEPFGPKRLVTHSVGNILYTLDDQPALALYKRYLGDRAAGLPATGLLFPLHLLASRDAKDGLVRTILAVDDVEQSLTFAGDIPQGHYVRLMKAGCDALVDGAEAAARAAVLNTRADSRFAILVSCVGRRLVMGQRVEEEVDAVLSQLGPDLDAAGFYSYGEICPSGLVHGCDLHNQTMTLTVFAEDA